MNQKRKNNVRKIISLIVFTIALVFIIGISYSLYTNSVTSHDIKSVAGDIYMKYTTGQVKSISMIPSDSYNENDYYEFSINGKNTSDKDIVYDIVLNHGENYNNPYVRLNDKYLRFRLVTVSNNVETEVIDKVAYEDITNKTIYVGTVNKNSSSDVNTVYRLYTWVEGVIVGNVNQDYTTEQWEHVYTNINITVNGDFSTKSESGSILVTFDANGGTANLKTKFYNPGDKYGVLPIASKSGYIFDGWYKENTFINKVESTTDVENVRNITLYANYASNNTEFSISYSLDGGTVTNTTIYTPGTDSFTLNNPTKTGYTFTGWTGSNGNIPEKVVTITKGSTGNKTYTANWEANTYTINYVLNGGTGNNPTSGIYDADVEISNPTKSITITPNGNGTGATIGNSVTEAQTFNGWTSSTIGSNAKTGTTSNPNTAWDGTSTTNTHFKNLIETGTVTMTATWASKNITLPSIEKNGYICKWYTDSVSGDELGLGGDSYTINSTDGNQEIFARCTVDNYTITYDLDGGSVETANPTSYNIETSTITLNNPTKTGYTFTGWTGSNGDTPSTSVSIATGSYGNKTYTANYLVDAISNVSFTAASNSIDYGSTTTTSLSYSGTANTIAYSSNNTGVATVSESGVISGAGAGDATITVTLTDYEGTITTETVSITINRVASSITCKSAQNWTGSAITAYSDSSGCASYTNGSPTAAGDYTVTCIGDDNHNDSTCNFTINRVAATCPTLSDTTVNWNGNQHSIGVSGGSGGTIQYKWNTTSGSWSNTKPTASTAGTYKTYVQVSGDSNHTTKDCGYKTLTINKVNSSITCKSAQNWTGSAITAYSSSSGCKNYTNGSPTAAGTYTVTCNGDDNHNNSSCSFTIKKVNSSITCKSAQTYTGNPITSYSSSSGCKSITNGSPTTAGTYTVTCNGDNNHNNSTCSFTINKKGTTMSLNPTSGTIACGGSTTTSITTNGDGGLSCSTSNGTISSCSVSGKTVTISGKSGQSGSATITVSQAAGTNYSATSKTYSLTINSCASWHYKNMWSKSTICPKGGSCPNSCSNDHGTSIWGCTSSQTTAPTSDYQQGGKYCWCKY